MKRRHIMLLPVVLVLIVGGVFLYSRSASYGVEAGPGQDSRAGVKPAAEPPVTATIAKDLITLRVDLRSKAGPNGKVPTQWDGQLKVSPGQVRSLRLWQDDPRDKIENTQWRLTTGRESQWNPQARRRGHQTTAPKDGALILELADAVPETELAFETQQGNFSLALKDVGWGTSKSFLKGLVHVARVADSATILSAPTEDDYPVAAMGRDGRLYVAYVAFTHGKDFRERPKIPEMPNDYSFLAEPTGGDQVLLLRLDGDKWTGPTAVTPSGQDLFRPAIAIDGSGGVWVFWSANRDGNWDLFARRLSGDDWSPEQRLTTQAGPDICPAAATDSSGKVWVTWQALRDGEGNILAASQEADGFSKPVVVSDASGNQWAPAIAASSDGRVAVAWDSYEKGNYDVLCRVASAGQFGKTIAIARTLKAETRPSLAFDAQGRLWVAYEEGPEKWGKDWGALEKSGVALYQERTVAVRVLSAEGGLLRPAEAPALAFTPGPRPAGKTAADAGQTGPAEDQTQVLRAAIDARAGPRQRLALPRLCAGTDGRMWLAIRTPRLGDRVEVGTAWFEHVAWYEDNQWSGEIVCPKTDNLLDNRPALVGLPDGGLLLVSSSDSRYATASRLPPGALQQLRNAGEKVEEREVRSPWPDPINNELTMARIGPVSSGAARPAVLEAASTDEPAADPEATKEAADVARLRAARVTVGGKTLQLRRGEFHRHTEISQDGAGDGTLLDMWRYGIDIASLDWIGNGDHDNGGGREYSWWITQKTTDMFHLGGAFTPMFTYERSCVYPDGHRNVVFAKRGIRTLPRLQGGMGRDLDSQGPDAPRPPTPDTQMLYAYLARFDGVCASHTSGTNMGTDWRNNDPKVEPIVEIYQGCRQNYEMPGAPRSNTADDSIGGWRPMGFVSLALKKGYRLGFQASSDHISTHISYCNVWAEAPTREAILAAMKARHVYGSTDNILADVRCGEHFMGDEFTLKTKPKLTIHLTGTGPIAKVSVIKDGNYVHTAEPNQLHVRTEWTDFDVAAGKTSYYYVRGEQADGELVWVSPMWITYQP
ncbi:MAG: hypothetical protein HY718_08255 [Planctomycetes bacterium]|nr:hypothetical protein [Planctomycetota bacterium]